MLPFNSSRRKIRHAAKKRLFGGISGFNGDPVAWPAKEPVGNLDNKA